MEVKEFYKACEDILDAKTEYEEKVLYTKYNHETGEPYKIPTRGSRWGGREPGNGRFPGKGLIRVFGSIIHVSLNDPKIQRTFNSFEEVLAALEEAVGVTSVEQKIGDEIDVIIMGKPMGKGTIVDEYDDRQWIVSFVEFNNGHSQNVKRFIDKKS